MLRIRPEQYTAFEEAAHADFHRRLTQYLRAELPEQTAEMDDRALAHRVADAERRATAHGVVTENGVAQFACLTFLGGPEFDQMPEVREYLHEENGLTPDEKVETLVDYLADQPE